jgi:hypothetical protein
MDTSQLEKRIIEAVQEMLKDVKPKYKSTQYYLENVEGYRQKANKWSLDSYHRNKEKVLARKKERYQTDPAFRAKCIERATKRKERIRQEKAQRNSDEASS